MSHQPSPPRFRGDKIFCPICQEYVELITIQRAMSLAKVSRSTIYNYLEAGDIHAVKIGGKTRRICIESLLKPDTGR